MMGNGTTASFQDNGAHGEDAFLIRELSDTASVDAVLDGVTRCEGAYASAFTVQLLQSAPIERLSDLIDTLEEANNTLFQSGKGRNLLTTVSVALKLGDQLHVINSGDSPAYLIRGREMRELSTITRSKLFPSHVIGAVGLYSQFTYEYQTLELLPNDKLVLSTDGLINNVFPEELAEIVGRSGSAESAVSALGELASEKKRSRTGRKDTYGTFREDDQTVLIRYLD